MKETPDFEKLKKFLSQLLEKSAGSPIFATDQSLILTGLLDSLSVTKLVLFLEENYEVDLSQKVSDVADLDTFQKIKDLIITN